MGVTRDRRIERNCTVYGLQGYSRVWQVWDRIELTVCVLNHQLQLFAELRRREAHERHRPTLQLTLDWRSVVTLTLCHGARLARTDADWDGIDAASASTDAARCKIDAEDWRRLTQIDVVTLVTQPHWRWLTLHNLLFDVFNILEGVYPHRLWCYIMYWLLP
jgi:hypothetical protein